jgi:hypothetical protein
MDRAFQAILPLAMRLDLTDEEAAALLSLLNLAIDDDRYPLFTTDQGVAHHPGEVAGCATGTAAGETSDTRRTNARSSATLWSAAALGRLMTPLGPCDYHISLPAAALGAD